MFQVGDEVEIVSVPQNFQAHWGRVGDRGQVLGVLSSQSVAIFGVGSGDRPYFWATEDLRKIDASAKVVAISSHKDYDGSRAPHEDPRDVVLRAVEEYLTPRVGGVPESRGYAVLQRVRAVLGVS